MSSVPVSVLTAILTAILTGILTAPILTPWPSPPCALLVVVQSCHPSPLSSPLSSLQSSPPKPPPVLVGALSCHAVPAHPHQNLTAILPAVLVVAQSCDPLSSPPSSPLSSNPPALTTSAGRRVIRPRRYPHPPVPAPPPETRDGGQTVRTWVAAARPGAAAIVRARALQRGWGGCRAFGGCSDCEGTWQRQRGCRRPCLAPPRWTFRWHHFSGNISVATFCVVASSSRRVVAASSSSSRRRRRRVVVLVASSSSSPRRRRVVSSLRRVIRPRLYPHPRPSPPVLVVALSCVRLYPTAILPPRPSPPVLVVESCHPSPPLSSPESSPLSSPPTLTTSPPGSQHLYLKPVREGCSNCEATTLGGCSDCEGLGHCSEAKAAAATSVRACTLQRGWGAAGSCSECELRAAEGNSDCEGTWGLQAVVVVRRGRVVVCLPRRGSVATFRWQHSVRVVVSSPRRPAVSSPRRYPSPPLSSPESPPSSSPSPSSPLVAARRCGSSSPLVVAARRRVVARSPQMYPHRYPHKYIGIHKEVSTQATSAGSRVSSVPASILTSPPGPVVWAAATVRALGGCSHCEAGAIVRGPGPQRL